MGTKCVFFFCLFSFVFPQPLFDLVSVTCCPLIFSNPTRQILVFTRPLYCKLKLKMDAKELILLLGWFEGPWRAEPALHSRDVSRTSRWLSPRELPYLPDKDYIPLGGILALNRSRLVFFPPKKPCFWKELSSAIQGSLVTFNSELAGSIYPDRALSSDENCFVVQPFSSTVPSLRALQGNGGSTVSYRELRLSVPQNALVVEWFAMFLILKMGTARVNPPLSFLEIKR